MYLDSYFIDFFCTVRSFTITIDRRQGPIREGEQLILTCNNNIPPVFNATERYEWFSNDILLQGETNQRLVFDPVLRNATGYIACRTTFITSLFNGNPSFAAVTRLEILGTILTFTLSEPHSL